MKTKPLISFNITRMAASSKCLNMESLHVYGEIDMSDLTSMQCDATPIVGRDFQQILHFALSTI